MKRYTLKDLETGEQITLTLQELLDELNRDRSEEWSAYDESSTQKEIEEAIADFTSWELVKS